MIGFQYRLWYQPYLFPLGLDLLGEWLHLTNQVHQDLQDCPECHPFDHPHY